MLRLLLASSALATVLVLSQPARSEIIALPPNPTSATGHFSNDVGGGFFSDQITFQLVGGPLFVTFASATNDFAQDSDFITGFTGQLFSSGADLAPGGGDDAPVNPLVNAVPCQQNPAGCQVLAGAATLDPGFYFLNIEGTGGGTSGYGGNLTTFAVPVGPMGGLPALMAIAGFVGWRRWRHN